MTVALVLEYEAALRRPGSGVTLPAAAIDDVLDYLCATAERRPVHFLWRPALSDPGADLVLEAAMNGRCGTIVTFNVRDFAGSARFGVRAVPPQIVLRTLGVMR